MPPEETNITRRGFIKAFNSLLAATGVAVIMSPIIAFFWPKNLEEVPSEPVAVGPDGSISYGESRKVRYGRYPALVINLPELGLVAYSAVCTHFACIVDYNTSTREIECPCHEGYFNSKDGSVISGPPPSPLESIPVYVEDGTIYIGGEA